MPTKKYRLEVEDRVSVRIRGKVQGASAGTHKNVDFTLDMARVSQSRVAELAASGDAMVDVLIAHTHGWQGQRLVMDVEADQPAAFEPEAMRVLLDFPGMAPRIWTAWLQELGLQEKN